MDVFHKVYTPVSEEKSELIVKIKDTAQVLYDLIERAPDSREKSLAKTNLEQAVMWSVKGITA